MDTRLTQVFAYEGKTIRTAGTAEAPLFCAKDVCDILEIGNSSQAATRLDEDELTSVKLTSGGQARELQFVTESGLYSLILGSRKPEARAFKRWVTQEVLPAIRKTGAYAPNLTPLEQLQLVVQAAVEQERRQRALEQHASTVDRRLDEIEAHQQRGSGFVTVRGYCNLHRIRCSNAMSARIGRRAVSLARSAGATLGNTPDEDWGSVKVYPAEFVEQAVLEFGLIAAVAQ